MSRMVVLPELQILEVVPPLSANDFICHTHCRQPSAPPVPFDQTMECAAHSSAGFFIMDTDALLSRTSACCNQWNLPVKLCPSKVSAKSCRAQKSDINYIQWSYEVVTGNLFWACNIIHCRFTCLCPMPAWCMVAGKTEIWRGCVHV